MYHGKMLTRIDFDFTKRISDSLAETVISVGDIDVSRLREDLAEQNISIDNSLSKKRIEYSVPILDERLTLVHRVIDVPLMTVFPEEINSNIVGYKLVAGVYGSGNIGRHGFLKLKLRNYEEPERERRSFDAPLGPHSEKMGLFGKIEYSGTSEKGSLIVKGVYDILERYMQEFDKGNPFARNIAALLSKEDVPVMPLDIGCILNPKS